VTALLGQLDVDTASSAGSTPGHPPRMLLRGGAGGEGARGEPALPLGLNGPDVGRLRGLGERVAAAGRPLLLLTDGVDEARTRTASSSAARGSPSSRRGRRPRAWPRPRSCGGCSRRSCAPDGAAAGRRHDAVRRVAHRRGRALAP
jgi:hypothetical protein